MKTTATTWRLVLLTTASLLLATAPAAASDPKEGWADTAELSYVVTAGNSETSTLGFKNLLAREWEVSSFEFKAGGIRAESTTTSRTAFGTPAAFSVAEVDTTLLTAENYFLSGRYNRDITDRLFWFAGAGWDRNRFAGIQNRYTAFGGVGNIWLDEDDLKFRTDYSLTFTDQEDIITVPGSDDSFLGGRFSWEYLNKFGDSATYTNSFVIDQNFDDTDDLRLDMINALSVSMSEKLALKLSLQWLYDNQPSFTNVALFDVPGPAGVLVGAVPVELDELDTVFTASLVINF